MVTSFEKAYGDLTALNQTAHTQILLDDDVVDSGHDEADLHRVGGAGEVGVDLLRGVLVEAGEGIVSSCLSAMEDVGHDLRNKSVENVITCSAVVLTTLVVGEVVLHW